VQTFNFCLNLTGNEVKKEEEIDDNNTQTKGKT